jgi:hypothetical protein
LSAGISCIAFGYIGAAVPGVPSTIFFICALWFFKRSSPRFELWLLNHHWFGPTLRNWDEKGAISPRTKLVAVCTMALFVGTSLYFIYSPWTKAIVACFAVIGASYILSRKSQ